MDTEISIPVTISDKKALTIALSPDHRCRIEVDYVKGHKRTRVFGLPGMTVYYEPMPNLTSGIEVG